MTDEPPPRRLIEVGTFSGSDVFFVDPSGPDPAAVLLREAAAKLDRQRAEADAARASRDKVEREAEKARQER
jgi:hypothetical protein